MRLWMTILMLATLLPLAALLAWTWPALAARWRQAGRAARAGLVGLWLLGGGWLVCCPHDDSFTGLDNMTYRHLAQAFLDGRGFHDPDAVLAEAPPELRENFLLHRGPVGRPTRDRVFQLSGWQSVEAQPFFMPVLSLAAAGIAPALAPERFVPLVGALWLALVLVSGFCAGGGRGLATTAALVLATAWPAWFLRGYYAEGVGAALVAGVVATATVRPVKDGIALVAGFALGLAVSYHPTLVVLAIPVGLGLMLERKDWKSAAAMAAGGLAGIFPAWAMTRWVCQPYGDWTRWRTLKQILFSAPEHQAVGFALAILLAASLPALWAGFREPVRAWLRRVDGRATPWGWLASCLLPGAVIILLPGPAGEILRKGASTTWDGIGWPCAGLALAGAGAVLAKGRPIRERFWLMALCWGALFFLFIKGTEIPVGLWSQRRFLPVALAGVTLLSAPLAAGMAGISRQGRAMLALALAIGAGGANLVRWPAAYAGMNERGAAGWVRAVAERIGTDRLVVFDYYAHSIPYAAGLKHRVLGLGEGGARDHWPEVAHWLGGLAASQEVWVATSWSPTTLEEGLKLEPVHAATGKFPSVKAKNFFPAEGGYRTVENAFSRLVPLGEVETSGQIKALDGSPIGLRGPWGQIRDGATWSRQGSGIIGPVPPPGGSVAWEARCGWRPPTPDWASQELRIAPPWGGEPLRLEVAEGTQAVRGVLHRPAEDGPRAGTGIYTLSVKRPYDPASQGLRGYSADLGVLVRQIIIRIEPDGGSVPQ